MTTSMTTDGTTIERVTIALRGGACSSGSAALAEKVLTAEAGVLRVYANAATEMAYVEYDSAETDSTRLRMVLEDVGLIEQPRSVKVRPGLLRQRVTAALVLRELRAHNFLVLSTADASGAPASAGVNYGVSAPGDPLALYVMTRRHLTKARNIADNPAVSLVVPLPRRLLRFVPPATIQLRGRAEILDEDDPVGVKVFRGFWMGRRILAAYEKARRRGESRICFLRITPNPTVRTYAVGFSVLELARDMESAAATTCLSVDPSGAAA